MTWKICSMLALLRLFDARSVATEALRTADINQAVQVVMCSRQRLDNVEDMLHRCNSCVHGSGQVPHCGRRSSSIDACPRGAVNCGELPAAVGVTSSFAA
jgi:hypothetical protein